MIEGQYTPTQEEQYEAPESDAAATPPESPTPSPEPVAEGSDSAAQPTTESDTPAAESGQSETDVDQSEQFATEQERVESKTTEQMYSRLTEDFSLTEAELAKLRTQLAQDAKENGLDESKVVSDFYESLTPESAYSETNEAADGEIDAGKAEAAEPAGDTPPGDPETESTEPEAETPEEAEVLDNPPPAEQAAEPETVGEANQETEDAANAASFLERKFRQKAWQEFTKKNLQGFIEETFGEKYFKGTRYEDLEDDDRALVDEEFKRYLTQDFLPRVSKEEFDEQNQTWVKRLRKAGVMAFKKGYESSDMATFMRTLLLSDNYRSGHFGEMFANDESDKDKRQIDVSDLQEACEWNKFKDEPQKRKENWMMFCALLYRRLQGENPTFNPVEWTNEAALTDSEMKKHIGELFEACVEAGKAGVSKALQGALSSENGNATLKKINLENSVPSQDMMVHLQMMANHADYLENFFK